MRLSLSIWSLTSLWGGEGDEELPGQLLPVQQPALRGGRQHHALPNQTKLKHIEDKKIQDD